MGWRCALRRIGVSTTTYEMVSHCRQSALKPSLRPSCNTKRCARYSGRRSCAETVTGSEIVSPCRHSEAKTSLRLHCNTGVAPDTRGDAVEQQAEEGADVCTALLTRCCFEDLALCMLPSLR